VISSLLFFFAGLSLLVALSPAAAQIPRAERPTYSVGDKWILQTGLYELIRIENDLYIFAAEGGREIHLSRDLSIAKMLRGDGAVLGFDPPPSPAWPLEVGKSGSISSYWRTPQNPLGGRISIEWKVEAYEDVQVSAGTFKAFRIVYSFQVGPSARREWREFSVWYAPEARQIVKVKAWADRHLLNLAVVAVDRPELAPLQVALREPKDQARVDSESIVLAGKASSGKGVRRVSVTLNGVEVGSRGERTGPGSELIFNVPVKLNEGRNVLLVTAVDTAGETRQEARTLFYEKPALTVESAKTPPAIAKPAAAAAPPSEQAVQKQLEEERQRVAELARKQEEERRKAAEIALKAEQERKKAEELAQKKLEEQRRKTEELVRLEQEKRRKAEELARRQEEERKGIEELARLEQERKKRAEQLASLPPFGVTISSPGDQARVENETIGLAGLVSGGKGVSRVIVTLNGIELSRQEERTPQRTMAVSLPVKLRGGQNTIVITAAAVDGLIQQEVRTVHYEKPAPLAVAFRYPEDRARVTEEASIVAAVVTSSRGVARVSVTLNGSEVHKQTERTPQKSVAVTVPVTLREGANAIVVSASEPDGNIRQEIRTVIYERPKVVVAEAKTPPPPPTRDRWAVVIGVGRYESPEIPRLRYTVPDAEALYDVLIGAAGFKKERVLLITDRTEKKPTLRNIKWALGTFLARSAKKDDTVLIYFAGHGAPEVDQQGVERDGFAKYLVPSDAESDDLYSTGLPMDELQTIFARIEAERVVVFLDSCYSGAAGGRTFASKKTRSGHVDDLFLERLTRSKGRAIVTASRPTEVSIELADLGHGIFTYYLVQGLKGAADLNRDGIVSLQELYEYIEQQVTQKSRAVGGNQHPVMKGELEGVLPLVKVRGK